MISIILVSFFPLFLLITHIFSATWDHKVMDRVVGRVGERDGQEGATFRQVVRAVWVVVVE